MEEKFVVDDLSKAEWAVKKIAVIRAEIAEKKEQAEKMKADVDKWLTDETAEAEKSLAYFESILSPFALRELEGKKTRSFSLPSGKVGFRKTPPVFTMGGEKAGKDNAALLEWIKTDNFNSSHYLKTKTVESVDWAAFKKTLQIHTGENGAVKVIDAGGEVIPGMTATPGEEKFFCEVCV